MAIVSLNDILELEGIDPADVILIRHTLKHPLRTQKLARLAEAGRPAFEFYQRIQSGSLATAMCSLAGRGYVASFIGQDPQRATFVGIYKISAHQPVTEREIYADAEWQTLTQAGFNIEHILGDGMSESRSFTLERLTMLHEWAGKLIVDWPPPAISWWRWAKQNTMPLRAITEESNFSPPMPNWRDLLIKWSEISALPRSWRVTLSHWRAIYYIHDQSDKSGYIGSAYGEQNLMGRWDYYARTGHGDVVRLIDRNPNNFTFSILERLAPGADIEEVVRIENTWKNRLHTWWPNGLN